MDRRFMTDGQWALAGFLLALIVAARLFIG